MRFTHSTRIACTAMLFAATLAEASETFTYVSGPNPFDPGVTGSFTLSFTTPGVLPDGVYNWSVGNLGQPNTNIPAGVTFAFSDRYTTLSDASDLSPSFNFELTNGVMNLVSGVLGLFAEDPSHFDAYYGYTFFYIGGSSAQLLDPLDPDIRGLDYNGQHVPVDNFGPGTWTYSISGVPAVPEPASYGLLTGGLALLASAGTFRTRGGAKS